MRRRLAHGGTRADAASWTATGEATQYAGQGAKKVGPAGTALTGEQGVHQKYGMPARTREPPLTKSQGLKQFPPVASAAPVPAVQPAAAPRAREGRSGP